MAILNSVWTSPSSDLIGVLFVTSAIVLIAYVIYQRQLHPLSRYPGPFLASLTDLWQVREFVNGQQPYRLTELHAKHGPIVRYGPDKLSVTSEDAIQTIYVKNKKSMPKTEYYNSFGMPQRANLFNITDEEEHPIRRRQLLKFFSPQVVETYDPLIDKHIGQLRSSIRSHATLTPSSSFDLKDLFWRFMCDVITELVYGESWHSLSTPAFHEPLDIHALSLWGAASGAWSAGEPIIKYLIALTPHPWAYKVFWKNLMHAIKMAKRVTARRVEVEKGVNAGRQDLLTTMILGREGKTGEKMGDFEMAVECYGFLIAGVHPPATTLTFLFYHLLHNPITMKKTAAEIHGNLPAIALSDTAYSNSTVEQSLPYLRLCLKENFRITPVFNMPLPRRVNQEEGVFIAGENIPKGTSIAVCNHTFHHDARVWPTDHNVFDPSRWENADTRLTDLSKLMMHFGAGARQCIGKVLATNIIQKVAATLLSKFQFELADSMEQQKAEQGAFHGKMPQMESVGISDLEGPLMVRARLVKGS